MICFQDNNVEEDEETSSSHPNSCPISHYPINEPPQKRKRASCALADLLGATYASNRSVSEIKTDQQAAQEEVKMFRLESALPLDCDPLIWWMQHEGAYPNISKVARQFLCIPGTSVSAERVFSTAGDIVTAQRSVLKAQNVDQLVFLQKNLKGKL